MYVQKEYASLSAMIGANEHQEVYGAQHQKPGELSLEPVSAELQASRHDNQVQRKKLLASLRGQTIRIPNVAPLFSHWPTKVNPELERLRVDVQEWLNSNFTPSKTLTALQDSDFGYFGATWWPRAPFPYLRITTYLIIWLFTWDDEIDLSDGTLWDEFGAAQTYRDQTLSYVRYTLGIDTTCPPITNRIILNFKPIGEGLCKRYNLQQRLMVYDEIRYYLEMSENEQRTRLAGVIPSLEEFWQYRLGCSAVFVCLSFNEFAWPDMELPAEFYVDEDVKEIRKCTNMLVAAFNDLVSVKKEIKGDAIDSLVPILYFQVGDMQTAVTQVVEFLADEVKSFDAAAARLFMRYATAGEKLRADVKDFVDGCKHYVTGNFIWSLKTKRYDAEYADDESGDMVMVL